MGVGFRASTQPTVYEIIMDFDSILRLVLDKREKVPNSRCLLVAFSGIDGCGKGYLTAKFCEQLQFLGVNAVVINGDGWLNLPAIRFSKDAPARHFYLHAFRFAEMFSQLVLPLRDDRSINIVADFVEETSTFYGKYNYIFEDIDVILLEAIYLFQPAFRDYYDLSFWIDCSFNTALTRALARGQEGLSRHDTIMAYRTIYFPAQIIHFQQDNPKALATGVLNNDLYISEDYHYPTLSEIGDW